MPLTSELYIIKLKNLNQEKVMALVQIQNSETGEWTTIEISDEQLNAFNSINDEAVPKDKLHTYIDNMNIPAEAKAILNKILDFTLKIKENVINIGQKVIEIIVFFSKKFPMTTAGSIIGFILGLMISSIPLVGWMFGWLIIPAAIAFGAYEGIKLDIDDISKDTVNKRIDELFGIFKTMKI